jgi:Protein of unknown function (DUF3563)
MRTANPTMTEPGFINLCIQMAQSTFSDVMPSRTLDPRTKKVPSWTSALADWFYRQQVKEREAYLAKSTDIFDLERRIRQLERQPQYNYF